MQVARLLEPGLQNRSIFTKALQAVRAMQLELRYSKDEILGLYLTLAPMGGNLEGVRAASLSYYGKEPAALTLAQSALLVALPQSPVRQRPDRHAAAARAGRDHVLDRMVTLGVVSAGDAQEAKKEGVPFARQAMPLTAPHLAQNLVLKNRQPKIVTTIAQSIQKSAERMATAERRWFDDGADLSLVVVENSTRNVIAYVGGTDYWGRSGQVDLASRERRLTACARNLRIPSMLVKGGISDVVTEEGVQAYLQAAPRSEYLNISGAGHMVAGDRNDLFGKAIVEYLTRPGLLQNEISSTERSVLMSRLDATDMNDIP
jgi:membrane carboxypeptidase/penicillin-binding protein PbpC